MLAGLVRGRGAAACARRWSRPAPRRHAPPQAPPGLARWSRQPLGWGGARCRFELRRALSPALGAALDDSAHPAVARRRPSWVRRSWLAPDWSSPRRCRPVVSATLSTASTATSTWPTGTAGTRSGSRTALPAPARACAAATGERERSGHPTGGISPIDQPRVTAVAARSSSGSGDQVRGLVSWRWAGSSRGRPTPPALPPGSTWARRSASIGVDGVRQALLTVPPGCPLPGDFDPVWSPDGRSLVVWPCEVPFDGRTSRRLPADDPRSHLQWAYSPDGARVAYVTAESLVVAAADGTQARVLIPSGVTSGGLTFAWSPTGDRIAFDAGPFASAPNELQVVDVATGTVTSLATAVGAGSLQVIRFSPGGDRILFARTDANSAGTSLWSVDPDGSHSQLLVTGTGWGDWQSLPAGP